MDGVKTSFVESVAEGPDSEQVLLNMTRRGHNLIFATSFDYQPGHPDGTRNRPPPCPKQDGQGGWAV